MAADILIISLIASYCIFLIYKARKNAKEGKAPDAAETVVRVQAARRVRERQKIKRCRTE